MRNRTEVLLLNALPLGQTGPLSGLSKRLPILNWTGFGLEARGQEMILGRIHFLGKPTFLLHPLTACTFARWTLF